MFPCRRSLQLFQNFFFLPVCPLSNINCDRKPQSTIAAMDADQFRIAAHAAIEESAPYLSPSESNVTDRCCLTSHILQQLPPRPSRLAHHPARLPRAPSSLFRSRDSGTMACHTIRHRGQDRAWPHALAVTQLHGLLPRRRHLPLTPR
jgi:hypothetical protein